MDYSADLFQLKDPSLFISGAFIDGKWVKKEKTFDVYGKSWDKDMRPSKY